MSNLRILECTLRDGSYAIDFRFTAQDTRALGQSLETLGFELVEVGHGNGLGASERGLGRAIESDEGYMRSCAEVFRKARWGMFCQPGIATLEHIEMAAYYGMGFIRVGCNVNEVEKARPYIERARRHGMLVTCNLMKSYVVEPALFASRVAQAESMGAQVVYLVDSAGGMLPESVAQYIRAARARSSVALGFHGHNNLGLAVINTLVAFDSGATYLDSTLRGIGRSAGNASTEQLLCVLARRGIDTGIDLIDVMDAGEKHIKVLDAMRKGDDSLDCVSGYAEFHSSFEGTVLEHARRHQVDPRRLVVELCACNKVSAPSDLLESLANKLADRENGPSSSPRAKVSAQTCAA